MSRALLTLSMLTAFGLLHCGPGPLPEACHERSLDRCEEEGECRVVIPPLSPGDAVPVLEEAICTNPYACYENPPACPSDWSCKWVQIESCFRQPCRRVGPTEALLCLPED